MQTIPLSPIPAQSLQIVLDGQNCQIAVYQKSTGLYFDLALNGAPITTTAIARDEAEILHDRRYLGFAGDFMFVDTQGSADPVYTGLGDRWLLVYLSAADLGL